MDEYVRAVSAHLAEVAPRAAQHIVDTVYFGGGTPSYLGPKRLKALLSSVQKHYVLSKDAEITLEANPDSAGDWRALRTLRRAGFNRISLGMQSSIEGELRAVGRIHTFEQVRAAVDAARKAKFKNVSLDLIYGLPEQTMELFRLPCALPWRWSRSISPAMVSNWKRERLFIPPGILFPLRTMIFRRTCISLPYHFCRKRGSRSMKSPTLPAPGSRAGII